MGRVGWFESGFRTDAADFEILFSLSDNAKSCFMISAFWDLPAFSDLPVNTLAKITQTSNAAASPINGMLIMTVPLGRKWSD